VAIAALERFADGLAAPDRPGVTSLVEEIRSEQGRANAALADYVDSRRLAALGERLAELVVSGEAAAARPSR
jgi:hypothetical protein